MKTDRYILDDDGNPIPCLDLMAWADWVERRKESDWKISKDRVGDVEVSTVFLALDHNYAGVGPPILYETMCFADDQHKEELEGKEFSDRYATREEAAAGHQRIVENVRRLQGPKKQGTNNAG